MNDLDEVIRELSDGRHRRISVPFHDEEYVQPFSGEGDEQGRAIRLHYGHRLPLEGRRDTLPDSYLSKAGKPC